MEEKRTFSSAEKEGAEKVRFQIRTVKGQPTEELSSSRSDSDGTNCGHNSGLKNNRIRISQAT